MSGPPQTSESAPEPWLHFWEPMNSDARREIGESLAAAGIRVRPLGGSAPSGRGIVFFAGVSERLQAFLHDASNERSERILAIAVTDGLVDGSQTWDLIQAGAADVLVWSTASEIADRIRARFERWHAVDKLIESLPIQSKLIGASRAWRSTLRRAVEIARFTDASVLLIGESGTGKELVARLVHELDPRAQAKELVVLDCTTVVSELSGSEFFGHERGSFTGAVAARDGAFALADGGTLFLDEVGELPMHLQAQLLRVIQERTYKRVGGNAWQRSAFRLVCATNRDLMLEVKNGAFRHDLYHRIASWVLRIPPLEERRDDILPLARHFLRSFRPDIVPSDFEPPVRLFLHNRAYPGNVRELRQLVARIGNRHVGPGPITAGAVPEDECPAAGAARGTWRDDQFERCIRSAVASGAGLREIGHVATDTAMRIAIQQEEGNLRQAARRLGVSDRALQLRRAAQRPTDGA